MGLFLLHLAVWVSVAAFLHTYFFYPLLVYFLALGKKPRKKASLAEDELPHVSVIVCVYNEEKVIGAKLNSLLGLDYPRERLHIYAGSDASTDRTDAILNEFDRQYGPITFVRFDHRHGKPGLVNELVKVAFSGLPPGPDHLLLFTDANVLLHEGSLRAMVEPFRDPALAVVDAHMMHTGMQESGISRAENTYLEREVMLKYREGLLWGCMAGPFGGCFALRSDRFEPVPDNFLVDDFYLTLKALEKGGKAISVREAYCFEAVSHDMAEEYRRKARISAGNFQNLVYFRPLWWPPLDRLGFVIFSHKVLRWLSPFFLITILLGSGALAASGSVAGWALFALAVGALFIVPGIDFILNSLNIHWLPLRGARYFLWMNLALLEGFVHFIKGIKSNVWQPPKRN